ncbi:hypothetical protein [Streptomyces sp. LN704]
MASDSIVRVERLTLPRGDYMKFHTASGRAADQSACGAYYDQH